MFKFAFFFVHRSNGGSRVWPDSWLNMRQEYNQPDAKRTKLSTVEPTTYSRGKYMADLARKYS